MKCIILSENLRKVISIIERSTGKDLTIPILGSFLISTEVNSLKIMGTNLEIGIEALLRGTVQEQGKIAIPAKTLSSLISTIPKDEKITLESNKTNLIITTQSQKTLLKGYAHEDFPILPTVKEVYKIVIKKIDILYALTKSLISTSKNNIKPELASIYFLLYKENLIISSTDSFRLSEEQIKPISFSHKTSQETFLLPFRTCEELIKLLELGDADEVTFIVGRGDMLIKYGDTSIYSRLTEGKFPEYQQIIPQKFTTHFMAQRNDFVNHLRRASIFSNKLQGVSLTVVPKNNICTIESSNKDIGEYKADVKVDVAGEPMSVVFNYHYLLDGLGGYNEDTMFFGFNGDSQPVLIRPVKKEKSIYIVMPMKGGV
jgi:DNA polymerase-3 subunit beta